MEEAPLQHTKDRWRWMPSLEMTFVMPSYWRWHLRCPRIGGDICDALVGDDICDALVLEMTFANTCLGWRVMTRCCPAWASSRKSPRSPAISRPQRQVLQSMLCVYRCERDVKEMTDSVKFQVRPDYCIIQIMVVLNRLKKLFQRFDFCTYMYTQTRLFLDKKYWSVLNTTSWFPYVTLLQLG